MRASSGVAAGKVGCGRGRTDGDRHAERRYMQIAINDGGQNDGQDQVKTFALFSVVYRLRLALLAPAASELVEDQHLHHSW